MNESSIYYNIEVVVLEDGVPRFIKRDGEERKLTSFYHVTKHKINIFCHVMNKCWLCHCPSIN